MSLNDDIALIEAKIDAAVNLAMRDDVSEIAKDFLSESVERNVYAKYPKPLIYDRRKYAGGLADTETMEARYDYTTKTLEVESVNIDVRTGRRVAPVVESGEGYYYTDGKYAHIYAAPRPFHRAAELDLIRSGKVDERLAARLTQAGFKVTKI